MRGRKPKPTSLKILMGDQPCRINKAEPAVPAAGPVSPPVWLGSFGCELWWVLSPVLAASGLLSVADLPAFEMLCDEYDSIRRDPLDSGSRDRYRRLLVEFGLTPSSRSRLRSTVEAPKDKMAEFLARQRKGRG